MAVPNPKIDFAPIFKFLFLKNIRYKVAWGGRGSGKSWAFARYCLVRAMQQKTRILCTREIQESIRESVHQLLSEQIALLELSDYFTVGDRSITCKNGSEFIFAGLFRNVNKIKSFEGVDICWIEEAESVSSDSIQILFPTIRKPNSEILICFNARYDDDEVYQRFVKREMPFGQASVNFIHWKDNPYFTEANRLEKDQDFAFRPLDARNIWDGEIIGYGRKVWPEFDEKIHIREYDWAKIANEGNAFMAMDPAQHYYPFCLFLAIFPKNARRRWPEDFVKWIYAEWPTRDELGSYFHEVRKKLLFTGTLSELATKIYMAEGLNSHGIKILKRGIDTRFAKGSGSGNYFSGESQGLVSEFAKKENGGLVFNLPNEKIIDIQKNNIIKDLQYNTIIPVNSFNEPSLFISSKCQNLIMSLKNHRLEEQTEKEAEKYKDASDTMRILYATIHDIRFEDPQLRVQDENQYQNMSPYVTLGGSDVNQAWMGT